MVATYDAPLKKRPHVLNAVCVNVAFRYIFLVAMLNRLVFGVLVRNPTIGRPLVSVDRFGVTSGVPSNEAVQGFPVGSSNYLKADVTVALHSAYHYGLITLIAPTLTFHPATYKGFVNLDYAFQELGVNFIKSSAYAVREIPSGL